MTKGYILVEGHGDVDAIHNLVVRLSYKKLKLSLAWAKPRRWLNLHQWEAQTRGGVRAGVEFVRTKDDAGALLILRDEDDKCPRELAPQIAGQLRTLNLPFPTAYILLHPEYEVLFLPCLSRMGFPPWDKVSWEERRGIKEWLSKQLPPGRSYKPTIDQLPMTRKIDFPTLQRADVPCFGSLERALIFLNQNIGNQGEVYP